LVTSIKQPREHDLAVVVHAGNPSAFCLGLAQGGQEQSRQNGDDGDNDQEFNERETSLS
jgi:hypothetical protein